ncbi:hypothetical protein BOX15_Mlig015474g1 [Macrostomum lignano]|uniref:Uncharacterized protein n=1 Tax=Macrostomum lignano TaxID=282301 RepID=A0A267F5X6_9PLAT|nr:hypothetical protein BOX15_Mlig015474g1 [Macrostomum lignano]
MTNREQQAFPTINLLLSLLLLLAVAGGGNGEEEGFRAGRSLLAAGRNSVTSIVDRKFQQPVHNDGEPLPARDPNEPLKISDNLTIEQIAHVLLANYDNHHRPMKTPGAPTVVEINMYIQSFGSISVIDMDYTLDIMLRQKWVDPRLKFTGYQHTLSLSYLKQQIWIPDLFFRNSKYGFLHEITTPNYLIWLQFDGTITFSQKLTVKLSCPMQLWNFPMDTQFCPLEIGSYGFPLRDLEFAWMKNRSAVSLNRQMLLNEFEMPSVNTSSCQKAYNATGQFACLFVQFKLVRKFGFYLIYTYLPSILIVTISWISFWIDHKAVPARITLGLLSILALMTQSAATMQKLPRVSYIKAIDVWLFACLAFVVGSLLEFALVNMLARRQEQRKLRDDLRLMMGREMRMLKGNFLRPAGANSGREEQSQQTNSMPSTTSFGAANSRVNQQQGLDELQPCLSPDGRGGEPGSAAECRSQQQQQQQLRFRRRLNRKPGVLSFTDGEDSDDDDDDNSKLKPDRLDGIFVFAYPVGFLAFNAVYWAAYMLLGKSD